MYFIACTYMTNDKCLNAGLHYHNNSFWHFLKSAYIRTFQQINYITYDFILSTNTLYFLVCTYMTDYKCQNVGLYGYNNSFLHFLKMPKYYIIRAFQQKNHSTPDFIVSQNTLYFLACTYIAIVTCVCDVCKELQDTYRRIMYTIISPAETSFEHPRNKETNKCLSP